MNRIVVLGIPIRYILFKTHLNEGRLSMVIKEAIKKTNIGRFIVVAEAVVEELSPEQAQRLSQTQWISLCRREQDAQVVISEVVELTLRNLKLTPEDTNA